MVVTDIYMFLITQIRSHTFSYICVTTHYHLFRFPSLPFPSLAPERPSILPAYVSIPQALLPKTKIVRWT